MKGLRQLPFFLALTLVWFSSPLFAQRPSQPHPMVNMQIVAYVRMPDGRLPPQGVTVKLEYEAGGYVDQCNVGNVGRCIFRPPGPDVYLVTVDEPGYEAPPVRVDMTMSPVGSASFELKPVAGQNQSSALVASGTPVVAVAEFNIPQKARKEFEEGKRLVVDKHDAPSGISHLRKAIEIHSAFPQAYTVLGFAYLEQGDLQQADAALKEALKLNPNSAPACLEMGALLNQQKKYAEAQKELAHALEIDPKVPEAHYELAKTYWELGRWQQAEPHARQAAAAMPQLAPVHVILGNIDLQKRDLAAAIKEYQTYLRMAPDGPMAPATRAMLTRLESLPAKK
jgi:Flp pilus assembly protein TadD